MWWATTNETESNLVNEVERLRSLYQQRLQSPPDPWVIHGVGAGPALVGAPGEPLGSPVLAQEWHPLILVEDRSIGTQPSPAPRFSYAELDPESPAAQVLNQWQLRKDTLIEPVGPIVPAVRPGDKYNGSGLATVGLPVTTSSWPAGNPGAPGFLTVAHGVGPQGSAVTISSATGGVPAHVSFRDESARGLTGGDDIAVVVLDPPHLLSGWVPNQGTLLAPSGPPYAPIAVDLFGGMSGGILAQVSGALLQMGDRTWQWFDCWELGVTQPLMQRGDSGALAIESSPPPQHIFGHFVGGAVALRGSGFTHHWVQDLGQVLARQPALKAMIAFKS